MEEPLYDVYFTGKLVDGADPDAARNSFIQMFKASPETAAKFFNGKPQILKRGVQKAEALKYKAALHKAGMMVAFRAHAAQDASEAPTPAPSTATPTPAPEAAAEDWSLAPAGSDVLKPDERAVVPDREIDTSAIKLASAFAEVEPQREPPPPPPDTSHISVAQAGEDLLPDRPPAPAPPPMDLDAMTLAPPGADLEELHDELPPLDPDISDLSIAEVGADILEGQQKPAPPPAPATDHLKVMDPD